MSGWTVMLRGIRYRSARSVVVVLVAGFATLSGVLIPAYGRTAAQSVLTDGMRSAPATATALTISAESSAAGVPAGAFDPATQSVIEAKAVVDGALAKAPHVAAVVDRVVTSVEADSQVARGGGAAFAARLAWRLGVCGELKVTGACAIDAEQVVLSERSAAAAGVEVGDTVTVRSGRGAARRFEVVGLYTPEDPASAYWGNSTYFAHAEAGEGVARLDAVFTGTEDDVRLPGATVGVKLTYPVRAEAVRLDDVAALRSEIGALRLSLNSAELKLDTALLSIADEAAADQRALARSVPLIAVPLLLLAFVVLFLLVAALTEDRAGELALARLRGFPQARAARFGLGETLLLIVLGAPLGLAAGLGLVELTARLLLADGVHVEPRWEVFAAAAAGLAFACAAAWLATRRTFSSGVLTLLRRVPQRATRRAGIAEAVVATLALVGIAAALRDRSNPFALLAPAALALVAGIAAGRLLVLWARLRLAVARRRGHLPGILAFAQVARRPAATRTVVVLTTAVALLSFAAASWDIAARARAQHVDQTLGAVAVYRVSAAHPQALIEAVGRADPSGRAMAVVRTSEQYGQGRVELIGVQSQWLANVALWPGRGREELDALGERLRAGVAKPAKVGAELTLDVTATALGEAPIRVGAVVSAPGEPPGVTWLGTLRPGRHAYTSALPGCADGGDCRFIGLAVGRTGGLTGTIEASLTLHEVRSGGEPPGISLSDEDSWRVLAERNPGARVTLKPDGEAVTFTVESQSPSDVLISYLEVPAQLPVILSGATPGDGDVFTFPSFADTQQEFTVIERTGTVPRAGAHALLFDLDAAVRSASLTAGLADAADLRYEVWASGDAAPGLAGRLADLGVRVVGTHTTSTELERLGRRAPALGLRLYLLAGIAAAALGLGMMALSRRMGARDRQAEIGALRATGVRSSILRRALRRERLATLTLPMVVGLAAGLGSALLMLPGIPLVTAGAVTPIGDMGRALLPRLEISALPVAVAAAVLVVVAGLLTAGRPARGGDR